MKLFKSWHLLILLLAVTHIRADDEPEESADSEEEAKPEEEEAEVEAEVEAEAEAEAEAASEDETESEAAAPAEEAAASEGTDSNNADADAAAADKEDEDCAGSGDGESSGETSIEALLSLDNKCKSKAGEDGEVSGSDALAAELGSQTCNFEGMDENLSKCLGGLSSRVETLEQAILSGEGGGLEEQITLVLVKKGVIDCENDTQCSDDRACLISNKPEKSGRHLCELPCERTTCSVLHSECKTTNHEAACVCKEGFNGNGTVSCAPDGFELEENGRSYRMFDEEYIEFDAALKKCEDLGSRLPVLDSTTTIAIVKKYLELGNFSVFEQWDRSSRRVWIGLIYTGYRLEWADRRPINDYPESAKLFVWEARRLLSVEASKADHSRHYGFYIDGDIAKLPGGGRKGAAVLCEWLTPKPEDDSSHYLQPPRPHYDPYGRPVYDNRHGSWFHRSERANY